VEIVLQLVWWVIELFGELLIALLGETLADIFDFKVADRRAERATLHKDPINTPYRPASFWRTLGKAIVYALSGALFGWVSTLVWPHSMIRGQWLQWIGVLVIPVLAAWGAVKVGAWRQQHGKVAASMDQFMFAYCFALSMAVIRQAHTM
jgi:hypothetical protein